MNSENPVILCVDDRAANLKLLENMLVPRGYTVIAATNGTEALQKLRSQAIDLVLLDVIMPGMDGFSVCRHIKEDQKLKNIPVIMITALTARQDRIRSIEAGAEEFLSQPFDQTEALARIKILLKLKGLNDARERAEEGLKKSNDRLRELETLRDSLVHMIVHDLRNPLSAISGYADLLEATELKNLSEEGRGFLERIKTSSDVLIDMSSSMLDVSRMESGQMQLNLAASDLGEIVREAVSGMAALKGGRQVILAVPGQPVNVMGDAQLLSRLVQNLVGNAFKFVPATTGKVDIGLESGLGRARCTVRDNGSGIPAEHRDKVFDKFWQDAARQQGVKYSSGLGLTFCKMVVEAHGGSIGVDSEVGAGSVFWFELPQDGPAYNR